ncbi:MAG: apolipoprotein N-acyltransferase [Proteobacteria bacterium]|nr:apolipoprotein N-acyltransferase [Pseudomonadota bacterium]
MYSSETPAVRIVALPSMGAAYLRALTGRRRAIAAMLLGAAAALALPPLHVVPLAFAGFAGLVWLIEGTADAARPRRAAFFVGWWFGFGHFTVSLYWIANALLIEWERVGWMIPFAVFGISALLGVFTGACAAGVRASRARGVAGIFALALAWTAGEWLRGHVLTGFPWNLLATVWADSVPMLQGASLVGGYGLSALTALACAIPATLAAGAGYPARWKPTAAMLVLLAGAWVAGEARLADAKYETVPDVRLRLVQPNVPQALKWDPEAREANLRRIVAMSQLPGFETRTHVIWSETATAFPIWGDNEMLARRRAQVAEAVPPGGVLVTGAPRFERAADGTLRVWNSLHALDGDGTILATFDKFHLVPFGEYVPLRAILPIDRVVPGGMDFSAGPGPQLLAIRGLPLASPLICYEVIFPGEVVPASGRPKMLLNLTNDSWFGQSAGPYQHFAAARLRAVEEGLPLVRSAGGGISGVIDAYGRTRAVIGLGVTGILDAELPQAIPSTFFARLGEMAFAILLLAIAAGAWLTSNSM